MALPTVKRKTASKRGGLRNKLVEHPWDPDSNLHPTQTNVSNHHPPKSYGF